MPGLVLPSYHKYYAAPVKMLETADGGIAAWRLTTTTGAWQPANDLIDEILFAIGGEIFTLDVAGFVEYTEEYRAFYGLGDGAVAALYETVEAIVQVARAENRRLTDTEAAMVRGIRRRTYRMFEERLRAEGNPAADPDLLEREGGAST
jgi:hypothetical protein